MAYDFVAPQRIVFGWGRRDEAGTLAATLGRRAFIVCGSRTLQARGAIDELAENLRHEGVEPVPVETLTHEPEVDDVDRATAAVRRHRVVPGDFLLAVGGGAAMDLAKAVAAMATNDKSPTIKDYLEGVGRGLTLVEPPLPVMAMPTTAGTGTEATKNAVISSYDPPFKKSLRDHRIVPRVVLIDPELTVSAPPSVTAASGMDAITQLFESYISCRAKPIPQALAKQGLQMALPAIAEAVRDGAQREPREAMAHAALLSGMCLANSGLGMAHGVAPALGVHCRVPHGAACALMLPVALKANRDVRLKELALLAHGLGHTGTDHKDAVDALIEDIEELCITVGVPTRLCEVGVTAEQIPAIVKSSRGNSMSGNPREISDRELTEILEGVL
ncbi:MAG: iron-containing alcohol dehydrogenase [Planctomycetes bacterium]|nr:iron-containing alcohol dehydrogenase [Planctomycetota bacterium]